MSFPALLDRSSSVRLGPLIRKPVTRKTCDARVCGALRARLRAFHMNRRVIGGCNERNGSKSISENTTERVCQAVIWCFVIVSGHKFVGFRTKFVIFRDTIGWSNFPEFSSFGWFYAIFLPNTHNFLNMVKGLVRVYRAIGVLYYWLWLISN